MGEIPGAPPTIIGPYRLEGEIARGGMGIVYLAHDIRLDRTVALKALPADVASDPERLERFEREAKLLASLNHSSIGAIYDVVESEGRRYLALEHIEGETLAQRLAAGPLSVGESIDICLQIASGMEAAHERGVIHRDLKPGNVMITPGDQVKIVDFGLAKGTLAPDSAIADSPTASASSPTITSPAVHGGTIPGVILGTAPYLSPEQARGKPVDRRTDIWAWGCILYECLTGRMAFHGETVSDTIASILKQEPDWSLLPGAVPRYLRDLLRRCLAKDPRKRLRDIGDARLALEEIKSGTLESTSGSSPVRTDAGRVRLVAFGVALGSVLVLIVWAVAGRVPPARHGAQSGPIHVSVPIPPDLEFDSARLTRDGESIVLRTPRRAPGAFEDTRPRLYVRRFDTGTFEPIPGTEGAVNFLLGPSSRWIGVIAYITDQPGRFRFYQAPLNGSAPLTRVVDIAPGWTSPTWLENGDLLYSIANRGEYVRIAAGERVPSKSIALIIPGYSGEVGLEPFQNLPGNRGAFLWGGTYQRSSYSVDIGVLDFRTGKARILIQDGGNPLYAPTGHLLFTRGSTLLAVPFDANRLEVTGEPTAIIGGLRIEPGSLHAYFSLASDGTLFYVRGEGESKERRAVVVDAAGKATEWSGERRSFVLMIAGSPDGRHFAACVRREDGIDEIWMSERGQPSSRKIIAVAGTDCHGPVWSPDGSRIVYQQFGRSKNDGVYSASITGAAPPRRLCGIRSDEERILPLSWSPDGSTILALRRSPDGAELVTIDADSEASNPRVLIAGAHIFDARFSPDGRTIAYASNETGRSAAYVRAYGRDRVLGEPVQVSSAGARDVTWGRDGRQLLFVAPGQKLMAVNVQSQPRLSISPAFTRWDLESLRVARPTRLGRGLYDMLPDGRLLAIQKGPGEDEIHQLELTFNFLDELRAEMGGKKP